MNVEVLKVAVVGCGYHGTSLAQAVLRATEFQLVAGVDPDPTARQTFAAAAPGVDTYDSIAGLLAGDSIDAVLIATTHDALAPTALAAIRAGKHVMVEKPMAWNVEQARDLRDLAAETGRVLMVGHLLRFHPGVVKLRALIDSGELGEVRYVYGNRQNLGVIREDENALWSLGVHDISVVLHLLDGRPVEVWARGEAYVRPSVEDVVFGYVKFDTGQIGHLHLSWLDPHKMRKMTVVGSTKMAVFDDMEPDRKITVYDKGPVVHSTGGVSTHTGDIHIPEISREEPLRIECRSFLEAVRAGHAERAGPDEGLAVVEVLQAMQRSLEQGGVTQVLEAARA
jgi:predicted dehydrogenase